MKPKNYPFFFSLLIVSSSLLLAQEDSDLNTNNNYNNHSNIPISQSQETLDPSLMMIRNGKTLEKVVKQARSLSSMQSRTANLIETVPNPNETTRTITAVRTNLESQGITESTAHMSSMSAFSEDSLNQPLHQVLDADMKTATERMQAKAQTIINLQKKEVESAFAQARIAKSESEWNNAKTAAMKASNYWNEIIASIQAEESTLEPLFKVAKADEEQTASQRKPKNAYGIPEDLRGGTTQPNTVTSNYEDEFLALSEEEAIIQRNFLLAKAGVAEIKALGASPCRYDTPTAKQVRANAMIAVIKDKVWPFTSQSMKAFIEHPSEARMLSARDSIFTAAAVSSIPTAWAGSSSYADYTTSAGYAGYIGSAAYTAYVAYASYHTAAMASGSVSTRKAAIAASACAATIDYVFTTASIVSASYAAYAGPIAYTTYAESANSAESAAEAANDVADDTKIFLDFSRKNLSEIIKKLSKVDKDEMLPELKIEQDNLEWSISAAREIADFSRAVAQYKKTGYREENKSQDHAIIIAAKEAFRTARELKNEDAWKRAGVAAREAITICQNNTQDISNEKVAQQKEYWTEQANLADIKFLALSPCPSDWRSSLERANAIMEMIHEKFGAPLSPAMKEFIAHPNEATLRATGKSSIITMSAAEAEEALEGAEVFAKASSDTVTLAKKNQWTHQNNAKLSAAVTREVEKFSRVLAEFKKLQETAKQP